MITETSPVIASHASRQPAQSQGRASSGFGEAFGDALASASGAATPVDAPVQAEGTVAATQSGGEPSEGGVVDAGASGTPGASGATEPTEAAASAVVAGTAVSAAAVTTAAVAGAVAAQRSEGGGRDRSDAEAGRGAGGHQASAAGRVSRARRHGAEDDRPIAASHATTVRHGRLSTPDSTTDGPGDRQASSWSRGTRPAGLGRAVEAMPESVADMLAAIGARPATTPDGETATQRTVADSPSEQGQAHAGASAAETGSAGASTEPAPRAAVPAADVATAAVASSVASAAARANAAAGTPPAAAPGTDLAMPAEPASVSGREAGRPAAAAGTDRFAQSAGDEADASGVSGEGGTPTMSDTVPAALEAASGKAPGRTAEGGERVPSSASAAGRPARFALPEEAGATAATTPPVDISAGTEPAHSSSRDAIAAAGGLAARISPDGASNAPALPAGVAAAPQAFRIAGAGETPAPTYVVPTPVTDPAFPGALAGQLENVVLQGLDRAEITVTPPDLGPIRVELSLNGEAASMAFSAVQPETRQAIEQTLPTLRAMLSEHGILLGDASVGAGGDARADQERASARSSQARAAGGTTGGGPAGTDTGAEPGAARRRVRSGLLDLYA